ncbi:aldehyde dehydrogenase family protein [Erwinia sp. Leaf53]|uniref:aldehyde dehydrogenase family protein n=1 Tax=Erwinia sp. Leaf53 TaxID=1736225 RepID=UPI0006F2FF0D|nr:aldehyde dehydrogenase family protein [Erwinia sp. Leaf53]KQN55496.1 NAD-dependent phenylacetaldehyde dehydrogenase [Erwinia sp. Leaf53]
MGSTTLLTAVSDFLRREHGHFINGQCSSGSGTRRPVIDPASARRIAEVHDGGAAEVAAAMAAAQAAFNGEWAATPTLVRGNLLLKLAAALGAHREELAQLETVCTGKTIALSRGLELDQSVAFLRYFAGWAGKISGETLDVSIPSFAGEKYRAFTVREPLGVVVGILPWNFSIMIALWKCAAALICGNTVVLKPSEFTPLTLLRVAELAQEVGFPPGILNVINGDGKTLGPLLVNHPACAKVSFTGSMTTGRSVGNACSARGIPVTLELGGKNAALFLDDLSVEEMVAGILEAGYVNQGQICASAERFYLPAGKIDAVLQLLSQRLATFTPASPLDDDCPLGPLANAPHLEKVQGLIAAAQRDGDRLICGGTRPAGEGYYLLPAAIAARSADSAIMQQETFGPVGAFLAWQQEEQALQWINDSPYGLSASVWTHDLSKALRYSERIQAGTVWINMHTFLDPALPFGGIKGSGNGREFGSAFINDYTRLKSVMMRY